MDEAFYGMQYLSVMIDHYRATFRRVKGGFICTVTELSPVDDDSLRGASGVKATALMAFSEGVLEAINTTTVPSSSLDVCQHVEAEFERRAMRYLDEARDIGGVWENFSDDYQAKGSK